MGTTSINYSKEINVNDYSISKLIGLKDGRLAALTTYSIEIFSNSTFNEELSITAKKHSNFYDLCQLSNDKLITSSDNSFEQNNKFEIIIISLTDNNSYIIEQTIQTSNLSSKIIELKDSNSFASFDSNGTIKIYQKNNLNYKNTTTVHNNFSNYTDALYLENDELICSYSSIKFLNLKNMQYTHEINNLEPTNEIIKLNSKMVLVSTYVNKLYIIDVSKYEINSTINLDERIKNINSIKKSYNGNILVFMDNRQKGIKICPPRFLDFSLSRKNKVSDYIFVYKYESLIKKCHYSCLMYKSKPQQVKVNMNVQILCSPIKVEISKLIFEETGEDKENKLIDIYAKKSVYKEKIEKTKGKNTPKKVKSKNNKKEDKFEVKSVDTESNLLIIQRRKKDKMKIKKKKIKTMIQ